MSAQLSQQGSNRSNSSKFDILSDAQRKRGLKKVLDTAKKLGCKLHNKPVPIRGQNDSDPDAIAKLLCEHWAQTFAAELVDERLLNIWLSSRLSDPQAAAAAPDAHDDDNSDPPTLPSNQPGGPSRFPRFH